MNIEFDDKRFGIGTILRRSNSWPGKVFYIDGDPWGRRSIDTGALAIVTNHDYLGCIEVTMPDGCTFLFSKSTIVVYFEEV